MTEKTTYFERMMSKRGLNKFDTILLTNDGGKYSPSIRKLRQNYFDTTKSMSEKIFSPSISIEKSKSQLSSSSIDLISSTLKCHDCEKYDGLFQCCHCNQRLCIRCCNKHYKKVRNELEYVQEISDNLVTKIFHMKNELEKQKQQTIEQCQKWRIDTINTINKGYTLIIQTIHDEYEIINKEYEEFVEKEMLFINSDQNQLMRIKKGNLGSLLSSTTIDSKKSIDMIKQRLGVFSKRVDDKEKFSFQVKLPEFTIDDTLRVESKFGDMIRNISAISQNEDFIKDAPETEHEELSKKKCSSLENNLQQQSTNDNEKTCTSLCNNFLPNPSFNAPSLNNNEDTHQNVEQTQIKHDLDDSLEGSTIQTEENKQNVELIQHHRTFIQTCGLRRRTNGLPIRSLSSVNKNRLSSEYPWLFHRTNSPPSVIQ